MNIEMARYVSSPNTHDKVPDWEEFKISQSLDTQCLDDILWEFTYLCCFRPINWLWLTVNFPAITPGTPLWSLLEKLEDRV